MGAFGSFSLESGRMKEKVRILFFWFQFFPTNCASDPSSREVSGQSSNQTGLVFEIANHFDPPWVLV